MVAMSSLITNVEVILSQAAGTSVQVYAQPRIANYIQIAFDSLFLKVWWPQYMTWQTLTLDGVSGKPTIDPDVNRFIDYRIIFQGGTNKKLSLPPSELNPNTLTGTTTPLFVNGVTGARVFQVYPFAAVGTVDTHGRVYPDRFDIESDVDMDATLLALLAAWHYSVDDGNNPAASEKILQTFNTHFELITRQLQQQGVTLDARLGNIPTAWSEMS